MSSGDTSITEYEWDHRDRLVLVQVWDEYGDTFPRHQIGYTYDYENRLVTRSYDSDGNGFGSSDHTHYVYDGANIVFEFDDVIGDPDNRFLWGPAVDQLLASDIDGGGDIRSVIWPLGDHQGSIRDIAYNNSLGTSIYEHVRYDSFGKKTYDSVAHYDHLFAYTGRMLDPETGLQWNLNRWYDPNTGRWLSEDPISFGGLDPNLYRYVGNSPTNGVDPEGLEGFWKGLCQVLPTELWSHFRPNYGCMDLGDKNAVWRNC